MKQQGTQTATLTALTLSLALVLPGISHADRTTSYTYNALGQVETLDGPRVDVDDITTYGYDDNGNRISITNALDQVTNVTEHDALGRPLTVVDPNGLTTTLRYDPRGRLTEQSISDGDTTRTTVYDYDPVGNLIQATQSDGSFIRYDYDANGNPTQTLDANSHPSTQAYDALDRLEQQTDALDGITQYSYDTQDNLISTATTPRTT
jgi:YD repeat-containing protein